ncbi:MAG: AMP-binding protein [Acidocella sp.]|nr:AMP-binding protein [Acidocella sp.]
MKAALPVFDIIATHARARPTAPAVTDLESGQRWSFAQFDALINQTANWLTARLGPASGARVATLTRNHGLMLVLQFAAMRAGAIFAPFNWRLAEPEIAHLTSDCTPEILFLDADFTPPWGVPCYHLLADLPALIASSPGFVPTPARRAADAPTTLLYTSGTSGRPKGVMISELNAFWGGMNFIFGSGLIPASVMLCDMPLFHTAGLFAAARATLQAGGHLLVSRGFSAPHTLARIADSGLCVTHYFSVPQMAQMLWNEPGFDPAILRRLTVYAMGGAPNPGPQIERFARAGIHMSDGYGMSETCSNFGMPFADLDIILAKAGSCGLPFFSVEARIVDADGQDLPDGTRGELWLRGPSITQGYWNQPDLTQAAFTDGWFRTGDTAMRDADGFYFLVDRTKDMFISGGENVYPAEVEAVLAALDGLAEAAVIGIPDARWGEVGRAYVTTRPGVTLTEADILAHCRARLARFKIPASVVINGVIPRTATGKVQKHVLKATALGSQTHA